MNADMLLQEAEQIRDHVLRERRALHQMPGTGFDIDDTLSYVRQELTEMGLRPTDCGRAGLTALVGGKRRLLDWKKGSRATNDAKIGSSVTGVS